VSFLLTSIQLIEIQQLILIGSSPDEGVLRISQTFVFNSFKKKPCGLG